MPPAILFGEDFDRPPSRPVGVVADVISDDIFSTADMAKAREQAWAEGRDSGLAEAARAQAARLADLLADVAAQMRAARDDLTEAAEATAGELAGLLCAAMGAMLPSLCARHGAAEITAVAAEILPSLAHEPVVRVQVAPENIILLEQIIADLDPGTDVQFRLTALAALGPSNIRIRWHHGEAVRDATAQWRRVAAILAPHGLLAADNDISIKALANVK